MTETCREFNGITTTGRMLYRNLKITSALDEIYGGICKKAHAATELAKGLRLNLFMKGPFDPVEDYTVHEITLGHSLQCSRLCRNHDRIYFNPSSFSGKKMDQ